MAYVKRHPIKVTLEKAIKYILDKDKTDNKLLVTSNKCSSNEKLAILEINTLKKQYDKEDGILGFHFVQSFKPGETDKETAHQIGKEWAEKFLSEYQYILSTHVDKGHIHNHIIINSVSLSGKKYHSCINEREDIRAYSDVICKKYGLSIINNKYQNRTMSYKEWLENKNKNSWKQKTREDIDFYISTSNSFDEFIQKMKNDGYKIKHGDNVKYMTFKHPKTKRQVRGKTLGADYTEEAIKNRIKIRENELSTLCSKRYKYRTKDDKWKFLFKLVSNKYSTLETNILLINILLSLIFDNNEKIENKNNKYVEAQKLIVSEMKNLSDKLNVISKYNFENRRDIDTAIQSINKKIEFNKQAMKKFEDLGIKADAVCTEIMLYKKYKVYKNEYKQSILKAAYKKKHEYELEKFEECKQRLEKFGLNTEEEYEAFEKNSKELIEKKEVLKEQIYDLYNELEQIDGIKTTLDKERRKAILQSAILDRNYNEMEITEDGRKK